MSSLSEQLSRLGALPLPLEPNLGTCKLSLRQVSELGPGSILKLSTPVGSAIELRVGGVPFGTGELVRVGRSLAVRLSQFHAAGTSKAPAE